MAKDLLKPGWQAVDRIPCRAPGCEAAAVGRLRLCAVCRLSYEDQCSRRRRLATAVVDYLGVVGDPLFAVFGHRPRSLGAHVVAHLEALDAESLHVPSDAISDYIAEIDEQERRSA